MALKKATIVFEKPMGGLTTSVGGGTITHGLRAGEGEYSESVGMCPIWRRHIGNIAPGLVAESVTDTNSYVNGLPLNGDTDANSIAWIALAQVIGADPRLIKFGLVANSVSAKYDVTEHGGHNFTAVSGKNNDVLVYESGGTEYVLFSWEDNVDADIMRITTAGAGQDDDFFSTRTGSAVLTKGVPHIMIQGQDGIIYITNGRYIASYDPKNDTGNAQALDIEPGFTTKGLAIEGNYLAIIGNRVTDVGFLYSRSRKWLWDGFSPTYNYVISIEDSVISAPISLAGRVYALSTGRNYSSKVLDMSSSSYDTLSEYHKSPIPENSKNIDIFRNGLVWVVNGRLMYYGTPNPKLYPAGLHYLGTIHNSISWDGMVRNLYINYLYTGYVDVNNANPEIRRIDEINPKYQINSELTSRIYELPTKANIEKVKFYFAQNGTGASLLFNLYDEYETSSPKITETITTSTALSEHYHEITQNVPDLNAFYFTLKFNHASTSNTAFIIRKIEIDYTFDDEL